MKILLIIGGNGGQFDPRKGETLLTTTEKKS